MKRVILLIEICGVVLELISHSQQHSVSAFQIHVRTEPHVRRTGTRTSVPAFPDSKEAVAKVTSYVISHW